MCARSDHSLNSTFSSAGAFSCSFSFPFSSSISCNESTKSLMAIYYKLSASFIASTRYTSATPVAAMLTTGVASRARL